MEPHDINQLAGTTDLQLMINGIAYRIILAQLAAPSGQAPETSTANLFRMQNNQWQLRYNAKEIIRKQSVGLAYIHALLGKPGIASLATELITKCQGECPEGKSQHQLMAEGYSEADLAPEADISAEILPQEACHRMQKQLEEAKGELKQLRDGGYDDLAFQKEEEIEKVAEYLKQYRYRGHHTKFNGRAERDRKSVSVALDRAIKNIAKDHPALALHLENSIHTGKECNYAPEGKVKWVL